jgi:EAL domain-containing protein (putative c-di-GMP-specific phosphodiesterase class I)
MVTIGGSVGIALYPEHGADGETLLRGADVAMYVAKRSGSGHAVYAAAQDQHSRDRLSVVSDLRRAIACDELTLHYQPKLSCATGELAGVEALVRWNHPRRGLVPPDQFIPLAEQTGLIRLLGRRVLEMALRQCRDWGAAGFSVPVAVNLSMRDVLDPGLPRGIEQLLADCGVPPVFLRVEITESSLMVDPMRARSTLARLCEIGVRLSVDDYGTGYSSLRYLQQLPVDELKIDRSFVRHMVTQPSDAIIVRSTIDLAHGLGLQVVAEGVEDALTWQRLVADGCDRAQGYYMSKPLPAVAMMAWLHSLENASLELAA